MRGGDALGSLVAVACLLTVVAASFGAGATTHALLADSETGDTATIQIAKQNQGPVSFKGCTKVVFEPSNNDDFTLDVTTGTKAYSFDETDFSTNGNKKKFRVDVDEEIDAGEQIEKATLDGTTYSNPNYPC